MQPRTFEEAIELDVEILKALHKEIHEIADLVEGAYQEWMPYSERWAATGLDRERLKELADEIRARSRLCIGK